MIFEPLRYEHLKQMAAIEPEAFSAPWTERMFIPEVESDGAFYKVGVNGSEVICYGGFHKIFDEAHITNIAVKKEYRGKGYGKLLLSELISLAKLNGVNSMTLEVSVNNHRARNLYESFGFVPSGIRKKYYPDGADAIIMWKNLI